MTDIFSFISTLKDIPISKVIFFVTIGLMATGVFKFINGAYDLLTEIENLDLTEYVFLSVLLMTVIFIISIIVAIGCAYVYKLVKRIIDT